jgi:hypothetical protein
MTTPRDPTPRRDERPELTPEQVLALDQATGDAPMDLQRPEISGEERAAAAAHLAMTPLDRMPDGVRTRVIQASRTHKASTLAIKGTGPMVNEQRTNSAAITRAPRWMPWLLAACVGGLIAGGILAQRALTARQRQIEGVQGELARAKAQADDLRRALEAANAAHAQRLTALTRELDEAKLTIARFEAPADPAMLAANRTKLLEVPDTIRVAWQPFDLPDKPAELKNITGDVVWNDKLQTGYLRFVGLKVNDPAIEQYQVWVIDERGMEQKVSGGIFNATAQGEVIVPIEPGIDVGRVALFAITIEKPGGTWVPDLERRVVVAPRG